MAILKEGEIVMIYEDPLTMKKPEGKARLVRYCGDHGEYRCCVIEYWEVQFLSDGFYCSRRILAERRKKK